MYSSYHTYCNHYCMPTRGRQKRVCILFIVSQNAKSTVRPTVVRYLSIRVDKTASVRANTRPDLPRAVVDGGPRWPFSKVPTPSNAHTPKNTMLAPFRLARELRLWEADQRVSSSGGISRDRDRPRPSKSGSSTVGSSAPVPSNDGGQSYEEWLSTQKSEQEDAPPPPYSLEAEEPAPGASSSASVPPATSHGTSTGQAAVSTPSASSVPPSTSVGQATAAPAQVSDHPSNVNPPPVNQQAYPAVHGYGAYPSNVTSSLPLQRSQQRRDCNGRHRSQPSGRMSVRHSLLSHTTSAMGL